MQLPEHFRLYYFPASGNCYKVALMLELCEVQWEGIYVDYVNGETRRPEWRSKVNEMGEIPVLLHGDRRFTQSATSLLYLSNTLGKFAPADSREEDEVLRWLFFDNHKFTSYYATRRWLKAFTADPDPAVLKFLEDRLLAAFSVVEAHLANQAFVAGPRPTIADISMAGYLLYPAAEAGYDLNKSHPNLARWLSRISALPGWKAPYELMPGRRVAPDRSPV